MAPKLQGTFTPKLHKSKQPKLQGKLAPKLQETGSVSNV